MSTNNGMEVGVARTIGVTVCVCFISLCVFLSIAVRGCTEYNVAYEQKQMEYAKQGLNRFGEAQR